MSAFAAALVLIGAAILTGLVVLALLWARDRLIDRTGDRFDYGLTDDDAPRDDNDWPADAGVFDGPEPLPHRRNGEP